MAGKKQNLDAAAGFFDDITPARDVQNVQPKQSVQDKRKTRSIEYKTKRATVHVHTLLFADDLDALKEIAYQQRKSTNELLRDIVSEYIKAQS